MDTSAWYSLADPRDPRHEALAEELTSRLTRRVHLVTTNLVLAETHVLLLRRVNAAAALAFLREVRRPPQIVVSSTAELEERAERDWLAAYRDQDFSLTDAVSFAVMTERGIPDALTLDHHFSAAGFSMVPSR